MEFFNAVANAMGISDTSVFYVADRVRRVAALVKVKPEDENFAKAVDEAEVAVNEIGAKAFNSMFAGFVQAQEPKERVYKIKPSLKGQRIEAVSASGIRFSFGEVWCKSVKESKGIATNPNNREKLNMHGTYMGIVNPEAMYARELCGAIAALM